MPSKALPKFLPALPAEPPVLLDLGPVIGTNVEFFGERLGCKLFIEDLFADIDRHTRAGTLDALPPTSRQALPPGRRSVDGILCWDVFDYLDQGRGAGAGPRRSSACCGPGGAVMGFFCTASRRCRLHFTKYVIVDDNSLRHRPHAGGGGAKRVLLNRDIIRMFEGLHVSRSFLLKKQYPGNPAQKRSDAETLPMRPRHRVC